MIAQLAVDAPPGPCAFVVALLYLAAMLLGVALAWVEAAMEAVG